MIDRDFEQVSEEHMKSMTKGPAQEQCPHCGLFGIHAMSCQYDQFAATPAPSQPAGAREQAAIHLVSEAFSAFLEMTDGKPELDTRWMREAEELLCGGSPPAQQTAAKDAEHDKHIAEFQQAIYETCKAVALECGQPDHAIDGAGSDGDEIEFTVTEVKQAFNLLRESKVAAERERDSLRALSERLNRRGGLGLDVHEEIDAALKAGKESKP